MTLKERAQQIRNETARRANTAVRVGGLMVDMIVDDIIYVEALSDLPTPSGSVITLQANKTYVIVGSVDIAGNRLVTAGVCNLLGLSSETSFLTSTGLGVGVPLISSAYSLVIDNLSFKDVDTCVSVDGNSRIVALDWKSVNFINIPNVGVIDNSENFTYNDGAFLSSQGLRFTGEIGTIALNTCLLRGSGSAGNIIELDANAVITRRFRIIYSSIFATSSTVGINVNASATVPVESYILDTVNFSGGGTYITGVTFTSNKALFINCVGITNVRSFGSMFMKDNAVATVIPNINDRVPMAGVTEVNGLNQRFTHDLANNALRYTGITTRTFHVTLTFTLSPALNNQKYGVYIGVNRGGAINADADRISESEAYINTAQSGRADAAAIQAIVTLNNDDRLYVILQNVASDANATVEFMNMIAI